MTTQPAKQRGAAGAVKPLTSEQSAALKRTLKAQGTLVPVKKEASHDS